MRVFEFFSLEQNLPIPVDVVAEQVKDQNHVDEIKFFPAAIPDKEIAAMLYMVNYKARGVYASNSGNIPIRIAHIVYDEDLPPARQRLAVTKELIHICDSHRASANQESTVDRMIAELLVPDELAREMGQLLETAADKMGLIKAAAVLFPKECRDTLKPKYDSGVITIDFIAELTLLPSTIVSFIMSDGWDAIFNLLESTDATLSKENGS